MRKPDLDSFNNFLASRFNTEAVRQEISAGKQYGFFTSFFTYAPETAFWRWHDAQEKQKYKLISLRDFNVMDGVIEAHLFTEKSDAEAAIALCPESLQHEKGVLRLDEDTTSKSGIKLSPL